MKTSTTQIAWGAFAILALILAAYAVMIPSRAGAVGTAADAICFEPGMCQYGTRCGKNGPPGVLNKPCSDSTNGFTTQGKCVAPFKCLANSAQGQNGGMGDIKQALDAVKSILDMMKGKGGGGGGGGGEQGAQPGTNPALGGCTQYYNVTTPSSDPCAVYVPPISDSLTGTTTSAAGDLISSLLSGTYGSPSTINTNPPTTNNSTNQATGTTTTGGSTVTNQASTSTMQQTMLVAPAPGVSGDIQYSANDVTVLVNNIDTKNGTQVAGFYGTGAGGQPTGVISNMCQGRPWASNFLSNIIPGAFFDSLCELRGYKVGVSGTSAVVNAQAPTGSVRRPSVATPTKATTTPAKATSTEPYVEPKVDIWAVPASVPLGARTTVFWNAKGVTSCTATSPDGSFSQNTVSGGAATVPLSGPTTYTISCLTPAGTHVTNYVTVNLGTN